RQCSARLYREAIVLRLVLVLPRGPSCESFLFYCYGDPRDLHSFPTRRSSDLHRRGRQLRRDGHAPPVPPGPHARGDHGGDAGGRSEEHTSELQSREKLVCRLLLEKKKDATEIKKHYMKRRGKERVRSRPGSIT